jgi:hypothetical protein
MGRAMQEVRDRIAAVQAASRATPRPPLMARWNNDNASRWSTPRC